MIEADVGEGDRQRGNSRLEVEGERRWSLYVETLEKRDLGVAIVRIFCAW